MKILYAIQATGNGHISRAREIIPSLERYGKVDILISGSQADVQLLQNTKYNFHGLSFVFGKKGGVDHYKTLKSMNIRQLMKDMHSIPFGEYDLILNDFEPITAWGCKLKGLKCIALGHQASFHSKKIPKPNSVNWAQLILKYYAPATDYFGFHFHKYDDFIYTPIIRSDIKNLKPENWGYYTVYLPAFDDRVLVSRLNMIPDVKWQVFSKHTKIAYSKENVCVAPIDNEQYSRSLRCCAGLLTGAGFEAPSEALYLRKKLLVIPMRFQFEQQCNAFALRKLGIPVIWGSNRNWIPELRRWVSQKQVYDYIFPADVDSIVDLLLKKFGP